MAERAAHLVDHVFPDVPVRQWVLSLPYRLRYRLAWDHDLCRAIVAVFMRAVLGWLRRRAYGMGIVDGRGGAVVVIQRCGGSANLNVHLHALVLDGVFARDGDGGLSFHSVGLLTALDVDEVLATVEARVTALLERRGFGAPHAEGAESDAWATDQPVLAGFAAAAVEGTMALGPRCGARVARRVGAEASTSRDAPRVDGCHVRANGFDLHAGVVVPAGQRARLERVCRYVLRPPVAQERIHLTEDGQVRLSLRRPWRDGTTALVFDPVEFLGRLAVLVPRPRINLVLYHGVLGPRAAWRAEVVRQPSPDAASDAMMDGTVADRAASAGVTNSAETAQRQARGENWASLMARTFGLDVLACPRCGGRLRLIGLIEEAAVIDRILQHLGVPTEIPRRARRARHRRGPHLPSRNGGTRGFPCSAMTGEGS